MLLNNSESHTTTQPRPKPAAPFRPLVTPSRPRSTHRRRAPIRGRLVDALILALGVAVVVAGYLLWATKGGTG